MAHPSVRVFFLASSFTSSGPIYVLNSSLRYFCLGEKKKKNKNKKEKKRKALIKLQIQTQNTIKMVKIILYHINIYIQKLMRSATLTIFVFQNFMVSIRDEIYYFKICVIIL
jgi:hypothetical protein